jgi:hypothetical protein
MLEVGDGVCVRILPLETHEAKDILKDGFVSAVGHEDTARILEKMLGIEVPYNRATIKLQRRDMAVVAQYSGPRLPEGATKLPEGAEMRFYLICV